MKKTLITDVTLACLLFISPVNGQEKVRVEKDLLGEKKIPAEAYYGVQTARALENFKISGVLINQYPGFVEAWAIVKLAAARANTDVGAMKKETLAAIEKACQAVLDGKHHDQFLVDWYQGGAGTSTNMNANEVLANIALELSGHKKGEYQLIDPHDHLNMSQSTNDSYPTAIKVAILLRNSKLIDELQRLAGSFRAKGDGFLEIVKMGRTEMQDAVPMTVGQEFHAFASALEAEIQLLRDVERYLYSVNMGATAIGTGINVPKGYPEKCALHLARLTGKPIVPASDMIAATWDQQGFVVFSSALKSLAIKLSKIASDLILLASGPRAGLFEINLPALQPGSSIMPGKVNPVIPEVVNQVCFDIIGGDITVTLAAEAGQLQLNVFEPIIAYRLLRGMMMLTRACDVLRVRCVNGITANPERMRYFVEHSIGIVTALVPVLGYETATEIAKESLESGRGVYEIVCDRGLMTRDELDRVLNPDTMTHPK
jgi:aspartate ammonia-lyase